MANFETPLEILKYYTSRIVVLKKDLISKINLENKLLGPAKTTDNILNDFEKNTISNLTNHLKTLETTVDKRFNFEEVLDVLLKTYASAGCSNKSILKLYASFEGKPMAREGERQHPFINEERIPRFYNLAACIWTNHVQHKTNIDKAQLKEYNVVANKRTVERANRVLTEIAQKKKTLYEYYENEILDVRAKVEGIKEKILENLSTLSDTEGKISYWAARSGFKDSDVEQVLTVLINFYEHRQ